MKFCLLVEDVALMGILQILDDEVSQVHWETISSYTANTIWHDINELRYEPTHFGPEEPIPGQLFHRVVIRRETKGVMNCMGTAVIDTVPRDRDLGIRDGLKENDWVWVVKLPLWYIKLQDGNLSRQRLLRML